MIDLHLHLIPGIDDGAESLAVSEAMLTRMASLGFTRLVATPHLKDRLVPAYQDQAEGSLMPVQDLADRFGITVGLGYEHLLLPGLADRLQTGEASTLAGSRSVLVELPFVGWSQHAESSLFALQTAGFVPVLAHPERYDAVQRDPELALAVAERGVVLQLTFGSFVGTYGRAVEKSVRTLLEASLARGFRVILATDAHSDGARLRSVPDGIAWIRKHIPAGDAVIRWAADEVPLSLLRIGDGPLSAGDRAFAGPLPEDPLASKRRWWRPGRA